MSNLTRNTNRSMAPRSNWDLFREFDDLFSQLHSDNWLAPNFIGEEKMMSPATDIRENEQGYLMSFDVPGLSEKDVKIEVKDGILTVSGERRRSEKKEGEGWTRTERSFGRFARSFSLPNSIDAAKIEAQVENGELHLLLPKGELAKPKTIPVNVAKSTESPEKRGLMDRFFGSREKQVGAETAAKH